MKNLDLSFEKKTFQKSKSEINSPSNMNQKKKIIFNKILSRNDINKKIIERSINKEILNDNYLEFIIHEKIKYADVDKIIEYYSEKMNAKIKKYNDNETLISKKKKELQKLNMVIYSELSKNMKFKTVEKKEDFHDKEIDETKKEIKHKEHQIEIFQEIYNQSYKLNYKLTKKLEKENIYCKIYDEQYQKYNEIYNNSINKMQRQEDKLNELKNYFRKFKIINNSLITDKVKKINKLEYEIVMIKNNVTNYQERLEKLLEKILEFQKMVDLYKNGYNVRKNEYYFIKKIFLKEYYKMFEIYHIFKVDDFEQILEEFKLIKKKYNELSLRFHGYSKEIMKLNMELKGKETILLKVKEKINEKLKKEYIDYKKNNNEQIDLINTEKKEFASANFKIYNECKNRDNLLNICITFLLNINHKIIHSLNNSVNKSPFSFKKTFSFKYNQFINNNLTSVNINYMENIEDPKLLLFIISLLKNTSVFIYQIIINVFYNLYSIINIEQFPQINEEQIDDEINIIKLNSTIAQKELHRQLKLSIEQLKLKKKIYSRNKDDILNNKTNEKSMISSSSNRKLRFSPSVGTLFNISKSNIFNRKKDSISPKEFFQDYLNYYNKNPIFDEINGFSGINKKLFVERYTNDLVTEQKNLEIIKNEKIKKRQEKTKEIKEKLEEKELINFLKKKKNKNILKEINQKARKLEGEEDEEEEKKNFDKKRLILKQELEESKKPKIFKMKLSNPETDRITNRYEDIRMLKYNYIKNYSNFSIDPNIFNEYFYNVKKKFNKMNQRANKSLDLNKSNGLIKNYSVILPKIEKKDGSFNNLIIMDPTTNRINLKSIKNKKLQI